MRRLVAPFLLITFLIGCQSNGGHGESTTGGDGDPDFQATLDRVNKQYDQALLKRDLAGLDRIWADDLTFINLRGELLSKAQRMENVRTGATSFKAIDVTEQRHRPVGRDVAITTCRVRLDAQYSGQEGSGDYRSILVWGRRGENWQLVALQMTPIRGS